MAGVIVSNLKRIEKNTLMASCDIEIPAWRLKLKGCLWHHKNGKEWVAFPAREWLQDGQRKFADLVEFTDRDVHDRFQRAVLDAIHAEHEV